MTTIETYPGGYVTLVETWGSDQSIIEAARMSTGKGFLGWGPTCEHCGQVLRDVTQGGLKCTKCGTVEGKPGDEKLLSFLWSNKHATPFEMAGATFEIKGSIMQFREHHRHRTQSYNEMSARYTPLPCDDYVPTIDRLMIGSDGKNRQAGTVKDAEVLTPEAAAGWRDELQDLYAHAQRVYERGLSIGVPKELARLPVTVGRFSRMRASANLRNWFGFLALRMDSKAQWEIRQSANAICELLGAEFPRSVALFRGGRIQ